MNDKIAFSGILAIKTIKSQKAKKIVLRYMNAKYRNIGGCIGVVDPLSNVSVSWCSSVQYVSLYQSLAKIDCCLLEYEKIYVIYLIRQFG